MEDYISSQLKKIIPVDDDFIKIKITGQDTSTNWLNITNEDFTKLKQLFDGEI